VIYAIGDVHGEAEALREMLAKLPVEPSDLVIFLGDLINRGGLNPYDCVEQVIAFDRCRKVCLMGNHEEAMLYYLEGEMGMLMEGMNAGNTIASYEDAGYNIRPGDPLSIPESHSRFYAQAESWTLPFYITHNYIFTHAGWDLSRQVQQQNPHVMRWGRVTGFEAPVMEQIVVRGHTPMPKVTFSRAKHYIGVDTGCGLGGMLAAIALPSEEVFTVRPKSFKPRWYQYIRG
jgi:serine/threonine protein phosphatase 1